MYVLSLTSVGFNIQNPKTFRSKLAPSMLTAENNAEIALLFPLGIQFIPLELTCLDQSSCGREQHPDVGQY